MCHFFKSSTWFIHIGKCFKIKTVEVVFSGWWTCRGKCGKKVYLYFSQRVYQRNQSHLLNIRLLLNELCAMLCCRHLSCWLALLQGTSQAFITNTHQHA